VFFMAATFGLMLVVSLPVARLLQKPLRSLVPWGDVIENFPKLHIQQESAPLALGDGSVTPRAVVALEPMPPPVPKPAGGTKGPAPATHEPAPGGPKVPGPKHPRAGSDLKDTMSPLDLRTLAGLESVVREVGANKLLGPLLHLSRMPTATRKLISLVAANRLDDIPGVITPSQLHAVLTEIRSDLPRVLRHFR
jgi:hypothetical protein